MSNFCKHGERIDNLVEKFGPACPWCRIEELQATIEKLRALLPPTETDSQ